MSDLSYYIALSHSGLTSLAGLRLISELGSAEAAWNASPAALQTQLTPKQIERHLTFRAKTNPDSLLAQCQHLGIEPLTPADPRYPALLRLIYDPPMVLYVRGNLDAMQPRSLAVVGARGATDYGQKATEVLLEQMAPYGPCIVSGLAEGIDTLAHQGALRHNLPTVAVFGVAIDIIYPKSNGNLAQQILERGGALVSEYHVGYEGDRGSFPKRNRVISGLSQAVLVIEGKEKSGARITAQCALDENRQVMALPGSIFYPKSVTPNRLIQEGAHPVLNGTDVARILQWEAEPFASRQLCLTEINEGPAAVSLSELEQAVLKGIGYEPTRFDTILERQANLSAQDLNFTLTILEMQGLIRALPGSTFCRN